MQWLGRGNRKSSMRLFPADEPMRRCIKAVEEEQQEAIKDIAGKLTRLPGDRRGDKDLGEIPSLITPLTSTVTTHCASELNGESMDVEETEFYRELAVDHNVPMSPLQVKQLVEDAEKRMKSGWKLVLL